MISCMKNYVYICYLWCSGHPTIRYTIFGVGHSAVLSGIDYYDRNRHDIALQLLNLAYPLMPP